MARICFVTTTPFTARAFLLGHIGRLSARHEVCLALNTDDRYASALADFPRHLIVYPVPLVRGLNPFRALQAVWILAGIFRRGRFDMVLSLSPQAGIVTMFAAWLARVPVRMHMYTGQTWATRRGVSRWLLQSADRAMAALATHLLADSPSQRQYLVGNRIVRAQKIGVLANGSASGVALEKFAPSESMRSAARARLGLAAADVTFLYLGRINREKGLLDLAKAFARLHVRHPAAFLLIVGPDEGKLVPHVREALGAAQARFSYIDYTRAPETFIAAADVICLPSYREGFGSVLIEAAAMGVPAVASRIYGITDAVVDGETGLLHEPGDVEGIHARMSRFVDEPALRANMGVRARARAETLFAAGRLEEALEVYVSSILDGRR